MEKYGTIPKRFTKDWWEYFWTYYKIHTIVFFVVIALIIYTVHAVTSVKDYDLTVYLVSNNEPPATESMKRLEGKLHELSSDVDENNQVLATTKVDVFAKDPQNMHTEYANNMTQTTKFIAEATCADNQIYIVDRNSADILISYGCMLPVKDWATDIDSLDIYKDYFLSLYQNPVFTSWGFDDKNLYMGILVPPEDVKNYELKMKMFENAKKVANQLIKE